MIDLLLVGMVASSGAAWSSFEQERDAGGQERICALMQESENPIPCLDPWSSLEASPEGELIAPWLHLVVHPSRLAEFAPRLVQSIGPPEDDSDEGHDGMR
jgi:hypothetical protein